jgi:DNA polymerase III epsilon subunit-like protein
MTAAWLTGDVLAIDLETTSPDPDTCKVVTCAAIRCGAGGSEALGAWLINPGIFIPPEASAIHGITDAMVEADGLPYDETLSLIVERLGAWWANGRPIVAMNANFDLSIIAREAARMSPDPFPIGPILDPRVIDLACDKYRKGKRKLTDLAAHYKVKLGTAHSADGDALTAARIIWAQSKRYPLIADFTLEQMQTFQRNAYREWADHLTEFYASQGKNEVVDGAWPIRRNDAHTRAA